MADKEVQTGHRQASSRVSYHFPLTSPAALPSIPLLSPTPFFCLPASRCPSCICCIESTTSGELGCCSPRRVGDFRPTFPPMFPHRLGSLAGSSTWTV
jgi:hypothetical protein